MIENIQQREKEILTGIIEIVKRYISPERIILFGSRAQNRNDTASDFDIAVDTEPVDIGTERKIKESIEKISGLYNVDIVFLKSVDTEFRNIVEKTGIVIYERDA